MTQITAKRRGELVRKVFEILLDNPDGLPAREVLERVERSLPLTEFEKSSYPNRPGVRRFEKTVRFASIPHVKAGWLVKSRGRWSANEEGKQGYRQFKDPEQLEREAVRLYRQWAASRRASNRCAFCRRKLSIPAVCTQCGRSFQPATGLGDAAALPCHTTSLTLPRGDSD
jgi:restriction system protein